MKKIFTLLTKTLLVAVCLLAGASSAWADDVYECYHDGTNVVNTNDYFSSENSLMGSGYNSNMEITFTNNNGDEITSKKFTKLTNAKGVNFTVSDGRTASVFIVAVTKDKTTGNGIKLKKYNGESWEDVTAYTSAPETTYTRYETSFSDLTAGTYRMERNSQENAAVYVKVIEEGSSTTPTISATPTSVNIQTTTSGVEVTEVITVSGANLTGSTLTATLSPAVAGLSVTLDASTITTGAISTTATLHYTQTANAKGSTTLTLSDGTTSKDVTVNYKALVVPTELRALTDATTFDLTKVESGLGTVTPDDYVVLTDAGSEVDFADQLAVKGINGINVTWRGNAVQAGFFKFKTTVPGTVTVKFSDTGGTAGGDRAPRYANVNGTRSDVSSNGASGDGAQVTCSPIAVSAGEVIVKGEQYNSGGDNYTDNQFRVFEIVFTPLPAGNDVVEIGQYEWATLVSANDLDFTGSAVQAYIVTDHSGSYITTTQVNKVAAGTPVLLNAANGSYIIPTSFAGSADATTGNLLVAGTGADVDAGSGVTRYVLSTDGSKAVFKKINATAATVAAGKAYLEFAGSVPAPMLSMGGETTGINAIDNGQLTIDNYYNLAGQRVAQPTKGVYIVNGKKVVIK